MAPTDEGSSDRRKATPTDEEEVGKVEEEEIAEEELTRLFKLRRAALQMLKDEGYVVYDEMLTRQRFDREGIRNREGLSIRATKRGGHEEIFVDFPEVPQKKVFLKFPGEEKNVGIGVAVIKDLLKKMVGNFVRKGVLVLQGELKPHVEEFLRDECAGCYKIATVQEKELLATYGEEEHGVHNMDAPKRSTAKETTRVVTHCPYCRAPANLSWDPSYYVACHECDLYFPRKIPIGKLNDGSCVKHPMGDTKGEGKAVGEPPDDRTGTRQGGQEACLLWF